MQQAPRWKHNVTVFLSSQIISLLGSSLVQYAITWHITRTTQSGIYAMLSILCGFLPTFLLSPFAGVWADRYNRKKLIILSDAAIALSTLVLALLFMAGHQSLWLLLLASAVRSLGSAVQGPAVNAMLPQMVPTEHLTRVNGINQSAQSLLMLVSPMLAALLLDLPVTQPLVFIFFIDVVTAALAITVLVLWLKLPRSSAGQSAELSSRGYLHDMKEGIAYIRSTPFLKHFFAFCVLFYLMMAPPAFLTQLQVVRSFGAETWRLSTIEITFSAGMLLGGLLITSWQGFRNRLHTLVFAGVILGGCTILLGIPTNFVLYNIYMALMGLTMPVFNTPAVVILQERVAPNMMGRVFSVMTMLSSSLMPLGMLIFGPLADAMPIEWLLVFVGIIMIPGSLLMLRSKTLLAAGEPLAASTEA